MAPIGTYRNEICTKCSKGLKVYLRCFQCDAAYHAKCLLRIPGFQVDRIGHTFCCRHITFKNDFAKEVLASQEKLVIVNQKEDHDSDKDLENCLSDEDSEGKKFECDSCYLEFTNKEHLEGHYRECPYIIHGRLIQEINRDKATLVCSYCNEEHCQKEPYERHIKRCEEYYSQLNKVNDVGITNIKRKLPCHPDNTEEKQNCTDYNYSTHPEECMPIHSNEVKYNRCHYGTALEESLEAHNIKKEYKCGEYKYSTYTKEDTQTNERPFKCDECDYASNEESALKTHILVEHSSAFGNSKYSTDTKRYLEKKQVHTDTKRKQFKCKTCAYVANQSGDLKAHVLARHSNAEKKHKCGMCQYSAHKKSNLITHIRTHSNALSTGLNSPVLAKHSNAEKEYKCSECEYSSYTKASLTCHTRIHTNEKPFKCDSCDYAAAQRHHLRYHILAKHSIAEQRYKCSVCKYTTYRRDLLVGHVRIHNNDRPFKCDKCDYTATRKNSLLSHTVAKHSNSKSTYKCNECNYFTFIKEHLVKHMLVHIGE